MNISNTDPNELDRIKRAILPLVDGRDFNGDRYKILTSLDRLVTMILLLTLNDQPRRAAKVLNEELVIAIEKRLALYEKEMKS